MKKSTSETMQITRLALENWRNFTRVDVALQRRAFLVGPNASGKSNLLDSIRFLHDIVSVGGGFQEAVRKRDGVSSLRCLAARQNPDVAIKVDLGTEAGATQWSYELRFRQNGRRQAVVTNERVWQFDSLIRDRPDDDDRRDAARLTQTHLEQVGNNQPFRRIAEFLQSVRYLHLVPQLVREPNRWKVEPDDPYGGDFLNKVASADKRIQAARLKRIASALRVAVPQLSELVPVRDEQGHPHLKGKYSHWRPQGAWQTEKHFSDGTLRLLGLLWASLEKAGPLLLEEPELSLHPGVVRHLPQLFARVQHESGRQILLSTHSPDLLRDGGIGLDEVLLLRPDREGTTVTVASSLADIPDLLEGGLALPDIILPRTEPQNAIQLSLFARD